MNSKCLRTALLGMVAVLTISLESAEARVFKVLHSFAGGSGDGANPYGGVAPDPSGNFYVATDAGGQINKGTLTFVSADGAAKVVHSFDNGDGENADGAPAITSGYVIGTTRYGGTYGCGTAYTYTISTGGYSNASFGCYGSPPNDLAFPFSGPTIDPYTASPIGTAPLGGQSNNGGWYYYDFQGGAIYPQFDFSGSDGAQPTGGMIRVEFTGGDIATYIAPLSGGSSNLGTVTVIDSSGSRVLHTFTGGSDGASPYGRLLYNNDFFLYGTTRNGGAGTNLGTVFRVDISGGNYAVLHVFQGICCGNSDGSFPVSALTPNPKDGLYYGVTTNGGGPSDDGTVFKIDPDTGVETVVHAFTGGKRDGAHPYGDLYINDEGQIFGTTFQGGKHNLGVVFRLKT
ncbi:MAG TPA: choice-of-anchor tandem repeat GloVer-containing protein [Rhizomicrobium sp.]|nr:choice-of-anchor tandem repeat GloVer-containing protein [Rhizomicrobium sp.]